MTLKTLEELNRDFMYDKLLNAELKRDDLGDGFLDLDVEGFLSGVMQKFAAVLLTLKTLAGLRMNRGN